MKSLIFKFILIFSLLYQFTIVKSEHAKKQYCWKNITFESVLQKAELPSCLATRNEQNCTVLHRIQQEAQKRKVSAETLKEQVSIILFAHSDFKKEMIIPGNPALDADQITSQYLGFLAVTRCLLGDTFCYNLRLSCNAETDDQVFLISGHCSHSIQCVPISVKELDDRPTALLNLMDYVKFRLLERQLFIAKELANIQLSTTSSSEYVIQSELSEAQSENLLTNSKPVALFTAWPIRHIGYYHMFNLFIESALQLKNLFGFHVITSELSEIADEKERPAFRKKSAKHEASIAVYSRSLCSAKSNWAFTCQPPIATAQYMLTSQQISSFLLYEVLRTRSMKAPYPAFSTSNPYLKAFITQTDNYVISVVPVEEMVSDPLIDWEGLKILTSYLTSTFSVTYYPIIATAEVVINMLRDAKTGINLERSLEMPCHLIRFPGNGGFTILQLDQPVMLLDQVIESKRSIVNHLKRKVEDGTEYLHARDETNVPNQLGNTGHFAGQDGGYDSGNEIKEMLEDSIVEGRVDAFIEQMNFKEAYNVSGVVVVESNSKLVENFLENAGNDKPWLVAFVVSWSPLCKAARAILSSVHQCIVDVGLHQIQVAKVDCFEANELCNKLNIVTYPTIVLFNKGRQIANYTDSITIGSLCQFANLALQQPIVTAASASEAKAFADKFLPLKDRVFILKAKELSENMTRFAKEQHPNELIIHQQSDSADTELTAVYRNFHPNKVTMKESALSLVNLRRFVEIGHLDTVFSCTWPYLAPALQQKKPLVVLFHIADTDAKMPLLQLLHSRFASTASICRLRLHKGIQVNDLVRRIAGLNLPALVIITQPPRGERQIHALSLGPINSADLETRVTDWLDQGLKNKLRGGQPVERQTQWEPATTVYDFVQQVYDGVGDQNQREQAASGRRLPTPMDASEGSDDSSGIHAETKSSASVKSGGLLHEEL